MQKHDLRQGLTMSIPTGKEMFINGIKVATGNLQTTGLQHVRHRIQQRALLSSQLPDRLKNRLKNPHKGQQQSRPRNLRKSLQQDPQINPQQGLLSLHSKGNSWTDRIKTAAAGIQIITVHSLTEVQEEEHVLEEEGEGNRPKV